MATDPVTSNPHVARTLVVVLAGGSNSRFQPLRDKTLLPVLGKPLLAHHLDALLAAGFENVIVVANPRTEARISTLLDAYRRPGVLIGVVVQSSANGMGDAVLTAVHALGQRELPSLLITQAHDVVEPTLFLRLAAAIDAGNEGLDGLITGYRVGEYFPAGYLHVDESNRLTDIVEKPGAGNEPSDLINLVVHWHRDAEALCDALRHQYAQPISTDDHYERALADLFARRRYQMLSYEGAWNPIKYPWHVLDVMEFYLGRVSAISPGAGLLVAEGAQIAGPCSMSGVRVFDGARVVGPAFIGRGSMVGNGGLVRGSMVGEDTEIGYGCELARSWIGSNVHLHHAYMGDSVVDDYAGVGFGTVTANWPFYPLPVRSSVSGERIRTEREKLGAIIGAHVRTGIGVLLYPGVKIGVGSYLGPGVIVTGDIEPGKLVLAKQELDVRPNPFGPRESEDGW